MVASYWCSSYPLKILLSLLHSRMKKSGTLQGGGEEHRARVVMAHTMHTLQLLPDMQLWAYQHSMIILDQLMEVSLELYTLPDILTWKTIDCY